MNMTRTFTDMSNIDARHSPGPGAYSPLVRSPSPEFTISTVPHLKTEVYSVSPGPGAYSPQYKKTEKLSKRMIDKQGPKFGIRHEFKIIDQSPSPANYFRNQPVKPKLPENVMQIRPAPSGVLPLKHDNPSALSYCPQRKFLETQFSPSIGVRPEQYQNFLRTGTAVSPGVGQYNLMKRTKADVGYSMGYRQDYSYQPAMPGPGNYYLKSDFSSKRAQSKGFSFGTRPEFPGCFMHEHTRK